MNFLKNIALDLKAAGPAAVVIVWIICVTALGIFGKLWICWGALVVLHFGGAFIIYAFGRSARLEEFKLEIELLKSRCVNEDGRGKNAQNKQSEKQPE